MTIIEARAEARTRHAFILESVMTKHQLNQQPDGTFVVRDARSGRFLEVRGADSLKSSKLPLKKGIDLTKPIAGQVMKGRAAKRSGKT